MHDVKVPWDGWSISGLYMEEMHLYGLHNDTTNVRLIHDPDNGQWQT